MIDEINLLMMQIKKDEKQKSEQRIKLLQAQINPHFVANTLNTISWMAKKQNALNIVTLTDSMNTLLRSHLKIESQFISLKEELESVKSYLNIMLLSGNYDFKVNYNIGENTKEVLLLKFILQPIVENAILHGFSEDNLLKENIINITTYIKDSILYIEIFDNGKGMSESQCNNLLSVNENKKKNLLESIGCINVNERIKLVYKDKGSLKIESKEGEFTKVVVSLDLI